MNCRYFPVAAWLAALLPGVNAEPVQVALLPAKIVPEQAATLSLENGVVTHLADASQHQAAGAVIAVLHEERTEQEREELELKIARENMRLRDELRKLEVQRQKVQFYLDLSPRERRYAKGMGADDVPPTPESLKDIDERIGLLKREQESSPRLMKQEFERNHAKLTLKMPFAGRLQYQFPLPEDRTKPFEYVSLPGRHFAAVCDDSAFYITVALSRAELINLPEENFSVSVSLPEGRQLRGTFAQRKLEQNNTGRGDMLVYYFQVPEADKETAFNLLGSNAQARLFYEAGEHAQFVSKLELVAHPAAAECENWEQLIQRLYPEHVLVLVGERDIIIRPRNP
ncbi:MAG: hypothetical protein IKY92_02425 [Akkermansia sp.]|nr:hypothetical protein [Akkermansia sp.]